MPEHDEPTTISGARRARGEILALDGTSCAFLGHRRELRLAVPSPKPCARRSSGTNPHLFRKARGAVTNDPGRHTACRLMLP